METRRKAITSTTQIETFAVDTETGLMSDTVRQTATVEKTIEAEPAFVKLYLDDVTRLNDLPKSASGILYELIKLMTYENMIVLNQFVRKKIAESLETTDGYIYKTINTLIKRGLLQKIGCNTYLVNPYVFGKGKWADVKGIRVTIEYDANGKMICTDRK